MNRRQTETYQMFTRVTAYGKANVNFFPKNSAANEVLTDLEAQAENATEAATARKSAERNKRSGLAARGKARTKLGNFLSHAVQISRVLDTNTLNPPDSRTDQSMIQTARAFVVSVEPMAKDFIKHGLDPEDVTAAVDELEAAVATCNAARIGRATAITKWNTALEEGLVALHRLDAIARTLADNPEAMAAYETARTIVYTGGKKAMKLTASEPASVPEAAKTAAA